MRLRPFTLAIAAGTLFAAPALAADAPAVAAPVVVDGSAPPRARVIPAPQASVPTVPTAYPASVAQVDPRVRAAWLGECRRRVAYYYGGERRRGSSGGIIGALLGGIVGGVAGNRIDDGPDRAAGTIIGGVVGATVGAIAGSAIDRGADRRRAEAEPAYDYCEAYFDDYYARQTYAMAYAQPAMMMVPVAQVQQQRPCPCVETVVTEEIVPVRSRARAIPRRRPAPDKRLPM